MRMQQVGEERQVYFRHWQHRMVVDRHFCRASLTKMMFGVLSFVMVRDCFIDEGQAQARIANLGIRVSLIASVLNVSA